MGYIQSMSISHLKNLIDQAKKQLERAELYELYRATLPLYTKQTFKSFNEFYEEATKPKVSYNTDKSDEEIMNELLKKGVN